MGKDKVCLGRAKDFVVCCVNFSRKRVLEAPRDPKFLRFNCQALSLLSWFSFTRNQEDFGRSLVLVWEEFWLLALVLS